MFCIRNFLCLIFFVLCSAASFSKENSRAGAALEKRFMGAVRPFVNEYCISCHGAEKPKGDFDMSPFTSMGSVVENFKHWELALERLEAKEMPPKKAEKHPSAAQAKEVIDWILAVRRFEAEKNAGDPGVVLARRLSNAEYDYTIRDLTGVNIRPTREFPVDPANQAGFDNSGESLTMSPALLKKYLQAAKEVSDHLLLKLDGLAFAPHQVIAETDRDKYCVQRIVEFYERQPTDLADYFYAAWKVKNVGKGRLAQVAAESKLSAKYLATIWGALTAKEDVGPIAKLQELWNELPAAKRGKEPEDLRARCEAMRDFVVELRAKIKPEVPNLRIQGVNPSAQALVLWKNREMAANHTRYETNALQIDGKIPEVAEEKDKPASYNQKKVAKKRPLPDENLFVPASERSKYEAAFARFAAIFPDAFYVKERGRTFVDPEEEKANGNVGRLLSAGLHNQTGYFRDDGPLYEMILDEAGRRELDRLWDEFDVIASVPQRMHQSTVYFERTDSRFLSSAEFDFARAEDKDAASEEKVRKLAELYYAKAQRVGANEAALAAVKEHFERVVANVKRVEAMARAAEPKHLESLLQIAQRAFRRPLQSEERKQFHAFYRGLREKDGLGHEEAIRDTFASVLMSPNFLYRVDLIAGSKSVEPLDDYALASRLSYFVWSSLPDEALLERAGKGDLRKPGVLAAEARRMLKDPKARAMADEFLAAWLDIRRFEEHNSVDRERFPQFDNTLRAAMYEEPARFFMDVVQNNRSVMEFVYGKHTFVNRPLAKHYGMPAVATNEWVRVEDATKYGRGGILPMSVFLTKNSPGLRTSPVKRGYWVVRRVLGEHIPPPPPTVPELPADESKMGDLTLREALAKHREDPACFGCHARFDSYGLVFEGFGPIGERRELDLGGKPVQTSAQFANGAEESGVEGLRRYLKANREDDFVETLCRQLLAYGLGRTLILSDDSTVREMRAKLAANGNRFNTLVECIVTSPQFLNKRGEENLAKN